MGLRLEIDFIKAAIFKALIIFPNKFLITEPHNVFAGHDSNKNPLVVNHRNKGRKVKMITPKERKFA